MPFVCVFKEDGVDLLAKTVILEHQSVEVQWARVGHSQQLEGLVQLFSVELAVFMDAFLWRPAEAWWRVVDDDSELARHRHARHV